VTWLVDGNVLVALVVDSHVHHERAHRWFGTLRRDRFATCTLAELARRRGGRLATFDSGLALLHDDIAVLLPA